MDIVFVKEQDVADRFDCTVEGLLGSEVLPFEIERDFGMGIQAKIDFLKN